MNDQPFQSITLDDPDAAVVVVNGEDGQPARLFYDVDALIHNMTQSIVPQALIVAATGNDTEKAYMLGMVDCTEHLMSDAQNLKADALLAASPVPDFPPSFD